MSFKITHDSITPTLKKLRQRAQALPHPIKRLENEFNFGRRSRSIFAKPAKKGPLTFAERGELAARHIAAKERTEREIKAFMGF